MSSKGLHIVLITGWLCLTGTLFAQQQFVFESEFLNSNDTVLVFTPNDYNSDSDKYYPVVYLLHGWGGNYSYWNAIIDCGKYADRYNTIIICPDGLYDSWYINSPVEGENKFEQFFFQELVPEMADNFRISQNEIFITGLSMGGHGALYLFKSDTSYFNSAGSLSGLLDLTDWKKHYGISRVLGLNGSEKDNHKLKKYSVAGDKGSLWPQNKKLIVSCGTEDPFYGINKKFIVDCMDQNIDVKFIEKPGRHNSAYWKSSIDDHFIFFTSLTDKN